MIGTTLFSDDYVVNVFGRNRSSRSHQRVLVVQPAAYRFGAHRPEITEAMSRLQD